MNGETMNVMHHEIGCPEPQDSSRCRSSSHYCLREEKSLT